MRASGRRTTSRARPVARPLRAGAVRGPASPTRSRAGSASAPHADRDRLVPGDAQVVDGPRGVPPSRQPLGTENGSAQPPPARPPAPGRAGAAAPPPRTPRPAPRPAPGRPPRAPPGRCPARPRPPRGGPAAAAGSRRWSARPAHRVRQGRAQPAQRGRPVGAVGDDLGRASGRTVLPTSAALAAARSRCARPSPCGSCSAQHRAAGRQEAARAGSSAQIRASTACPVRVMSSWPKGSGSPAATRSCHSTRSRPVISSVTGCSTWRRVFISMK